MDAWGAIQWGDVLLSLSLPGKSFTESWLYLSRLTGPREVWRERGSWLRPVVLVSVFIVLIVTISQSRARAGS